MIRMTRLPNGVRVATERIAGVRSCSIGLWLELGSRDEEPGEAGLSHFIEHMLFKGTRTRDALALADASNELGGHVNAFTTQEHLCLHARMVDEKGLRALDLLAEMLLESTFPEEEVARERQVVLEECKMYEDTPDEFCVDLFMRNLWPADPLGRPVIGRPGTIRTFRRERVAEFWGRRLRPERLLVAVAGSFEPRVIGARIKQLLGGLKGEGRAPARPGGVNGARPRLSVARRSVEQTHFCLGMPAPERGNPQRYAFGLMNMVLGGGVGSRLFEEIRERRGLAYSIGSFTQGFRDAGAFAVNGGTSPEALDEVLGIALEEMRRICDEEVAARELELARAQVIDSILLGMENTEGRMTRMAESILSLGRVPGVDEVVRKLKRVTRAEIRAVARHWLGSSPLAAAVVGPPGSGLTRALRRWPRESIGANGSTRQ